MGFNSSFLAENPLILFASVFPALIASLVIALSFRPPLDRFVDRWRRPLVVLTYLVTRVALLPIVYVLLRDVPPSYDNLWWHRMGLGILHGGLPYRDFPCTHGPLFPYLMAASFGIWNHNGSAAMIFIAFDLAVLALLYKIAKETLGGRAAWDAVWLWTVNPAVWIITVRYAQDETIIAAFLLLVAYLYSKQTQWWHAAVLSLGILFTKFTTAAGMFAIYTFSTRKVRDAIVATVILVGVFAIFAAQGADITKPFTLEDMAIEGINITVLVDRITQHHYLAVLHRPFSILAVVTSLAVLFVCHRRRMSIYDTLAVFLMAFLILSPRSFKFYRLWYMAPLTLWTVKSGKFGRYAAYTALLCVFNDFSFNVVTPLAIMAMMYVPAIAIVAIEIGYVVDILKTPGPRRAMPTEQPAGACVET